MPDRKKGADPSPADTAKLLERVVAARDALQACIRRSKGQVIITEISPPALQALQGAQKSKK